MPPASGTQRPGATQPTATAQSSGTAQPPGTTGPKASSPSASPGPADDPVLTAERAYLGQAREYLRQMREDVLSLRALGGDRVSEEYLKADLSRRAQALSDLPGTPLFFGRLDYAAGEFAGERFHVGRRHVPDPHGHPAGVDSGAPVSRAFSRASPADPMGLALRRRFGFSGG